MNYFQHFRAVLLLGLPLIGSHLAQMAVRLVDAIMLGRYETDALAASILAGAFYFAIFIMGAGFSFAVMPMVAEAYAKNDGLRIRRVTRMGMWLSVIYATVFLPAMIWSDPLLRGMKQDPDLARAAQEYLRIAGFGLFPSLLVMALKNYLAAIERTAPILYLTVAGVFVNAGLNYLFIFGSWGFPELGLRGAAIASVLTEVLTFIAMAIFVARAPGCREHTIFVRFWKRDPEAMGEVFRLGWPIGLTNLAESGMFSASAIICGLVGKLPLVAHGIAIQITVMTFMVHMGLSQAATVRVGNALGRKDWEGMRRGAWAAGGLSLGMVAATMILFVVAPELLITGFLNPDAPDRERVIALGSGLLLVAAVFQLVDAGQVMFLGLLRGVQDARMPLIFTLLSYWAVGIPMSYVFGITLGYGAEGVWSGMVVGLALATLSLGLRWRSKLAGFQRMKTT
ncbi:MAG: MATE family efflux transporter [Litoreibacter sp.]